MNGHGTPSRAYDPLT